MTEEKKLPTIEEWFEENKSEEGYAGMTVGFKDYLISTFDDAMNSALRTSFSSCGISMENGRGNRFIPVEATFELVLSKNESGKIVYFIDDASVEYS